MAGAAGRPAAGRSCALGRSHVPGMAARMAALKNRPRLLFLCQTLPYPPDGGVWIRTYHVLRQLAQAFEITALCFERAQSAGRDGGSPDPSTARALAEFGSVDVFALPQ